MISLARCCAISWLIGFGLACFGAVPAGASPDDPPEAKPIRVVILVDESGSLSDTDVREEQAAAAAIATGEFSAQSEVAVIGFGSANNQGQSALDPVCQLTKVADGTFRQYLSDCTGKLRRRSAAEGNDTDYVKALAQAINVLKADTDGVERPRIVFVLTDGVLDVRNSPSYGPDRAQRTTNAQQDLEQTYLPMAVREKVQIWPLGFGSVDVSQLRALAAGGYTGGCSGRPEAIPRATVVRGSRDVSSTLLKAFAGARCAAATPPVTERLEQGTTADLFVDIPEIATDSTIGVIKRNPRIKVTFFDPERNQVPESGEFHGSTFSGTGESGLVESLRIQNPIPGKWRVHLESGLDVPEEDVTALVIWQGALRTTALVDPPRPQPGQKVVVRVRLLTRSGPVTNPDVLQGLTFRAQLHGTGFGDFETDLRDDGEIPDTSADDGQFAGYMTVPKTATGSLDFTGLAGGEGIQGDTRPFATQIQQEAPPVVAQIRLEEGIVRPGGSQGGTVLVASTKPITLGLQLSLDEGNVNATVVPATQRIVSSGRAEWPFKIMFGPGSGPARVTGAITVIDAQQPWTSYGNAYFDVRIEPPPTWYEQYRWLIVAIGAIVLAGLGNYLVRARVRHQAADVRGLTLLLRRDGEELGRLRAPEVSSNVFPFTLRDVDGDYPQLDRLGSTDRVYQASRGNAGSLVVRMADGGELVIHRGGEQPIAGSLALSFLDARVFEGTNRRENAGAGTGGRSAGPHSGAEGDTAWDGLGDPWLGSADDSDERYR